MKVLNKSEVVKEQIVMQTKLERHILANFSNPFLVKLHFAFQSSSTLYMLMDLMLGGDL